MEESKILVVDDNKEIREIINILLSGEGYQVIEANDGLKALDQIMQHEFDLIILDVMMPKMNGYQTCLEIRKISNAPILFLSAKSQDGDKTLGFSSGGDDYLPKPFSYSELVGRVKALIRRYHVYRGKEEVMSEPVIQIKQMTIDEASGTVKIQGKKVELTDTEFAMLLFLAQNRKRTLSAEQLYEAVWKENYYYGANNTVMVHIRNLRKKIEKDPQHPEYIRTIWGRGYCCD